MTLTEYNKETIEGIHTQIIETFLKIKKADTPCHRCGNNRFLIPEQNHGPLFVTYCSRCGFKNEHLVQILTSSESEE